jgi:hypothetical protein
MAGSPDVSPSHGYATVVGFGPSPGASSESGTPQAALDTLAEPSWLQDEMKRMEAYTFAQLAKLEEQRKILLNHQLQVEREVVLKRQQLNQQVCLISSRLAALQKREQAMAEREAALAAESERLRKSQQELLAMFQSKAQMPAEAVGVSTARIDAPPSVPAESAPTVRPEPAPPATPPATESGKDRSEPGGPPAAPPTPAVAPKNSPKKRPDPIAPTKVSPGHQAARAAAHKDQTPEKPAALRSGNPVSVSVIHAGEDAEPSPGWVVARSSTELHVLADEAVEVGSVLTVRPTKAAVSFAGVPVKVVECRRERNQWILSCRMLQKLSGAFLQLFG